MQPGKSEKLFIAGVLIITIVVFMVIGSPDWQSKTSSIVTQGSLFGAPTITEYSDTLAVSETGTIVQGITAGARVVLHQVIITASKSGIMKTEIQIGGNTYVYYWDLRFDLSFPPGVALRGTDGGSLQIATTNTTAESIAIGVTRVTSGEVV